MTAPLLERYGFDTVFDGAGNVARTTPRPKRYFTVDEMEAVRARAFADGEQKALGEMAALQARALAEISKHAEHGLGRLAHVAHAHREGSAALALACARAITGEVLSLFPRAALESALASLAGEIESEPRLIVSVSPALAAVVGGTLSDTAAAIGFTGQILVREDADRIGAAFTLDFGDGAASFDPEDAALRVGKALEAALAAEGMHAEPLHPGGEG
jgi:flagellar assembly protein FliH